MYKCNRHTFQLRWVLFFNISISDRDTIGCGRNNLWHCLELGSKILDSGPIGHISDITIFSRNGSIGGFVT